jgi:hypothetical protein
LCKRDRDKNGLRRSKRNKDSPKGGRKATPRGDFSSKKHPNFKTHTNKLRDVPFVPVLLGDALPRGDRGIREIQQWCRAMLILFMPWRKPTDLKNENESWTTAFKRSTFKPSMNLIMRNMNVENECKDTKDDYSRQRRTGKSTIPTLEHFATDNSNGDLDSLDTAALNNVCLDQSDKQDDDYDNPYENAEVVSLSPSQSDELVGLLSRTGVFNAQQGITNETAPIIGTASQVSDHEKDIMKMQKTLMDQLKKDKRPAPTDIDTSNSSYCPFKKRQYEPSTSLSELEARTEFVTVGSRDTAQFQPEDALEDIITEFGMQDNPEQQCATRIVAEHFIEGTEDQLLCHISGPSRMGKSHVVRTIVEFFKCCGASKKLMLSASTGCAAVLINGYTLHALTFLGPHKTYTRPELLEALWRHVKYLVIDEVSMISAYFFNQVSERICKAKALSYSKDVWSGIMN